MQNKISIRNLSMGGTLLFISAFFVLHPKGSQFLSPQNLSNLSIELAITATLALGMLIVLLPGKIDLSAGSGVGMLGGIASVLIICPAYIFGADISGFSAPVALVIALLVGMGIWYLMGRVIAYQKVPAFIMTLGGLLIFKGIHWTVIHNSTIPVTPGGTENLYSILTTYYFPKWSSYLIFAVISIILIFKTIQNRKKRKEYGFELENVETTFLKTFLAIQIILLLVIVMNLYKGVPLPLMILGLMAWLVQVITKKTPFGRYLYAIGGNEDAARLSGIPVEKIIVIAFVFMGAVVALTGFMQTAYGGYSTSTVGNLMELDAIAACVIGGTSLKGGRGSVLGVLFGALLMATLLNGMTLLALSPESKLIARGAVLILAVWLDVYLARKRAED